MEIRLEIDWAYLRDVRLKIDWAYRVEYDAAGTEELSEEREIQRHAFYERLSNGNSELFVADIKRHILQFWDERGVLNIVCLLTYLYDVK